jgi:hypothetical protein
LYPQPAAVSTAGGCPGAGVILDPRKLILDPKKTILSPYKLLVYNELSALCASLCFLEGFFTGASWFAYSFANFP